MKDSGLVLRCGLAICLLLSACIRYPQVPVSFPSDPRVLHGDWLLELTTSDGLTALPDVVSGTVSLQLVATDLFRNGAWSGYRFAGSADWPVELGHPGQFQAEGTVTSSGLHDYRPDTVSAQVSPQPLVIISGVIRGAEREYRLHFTGMNAEQSSYTGTAVMEPAGVGPRFQALLRRP